MSQPLQSPQPSKPLPPWIAALVTAQEKEDRRVTRAEKRLAASQKEMEKHDAARASQTEIETAARDAVERTIKELPAEAPGETELSKVQAWLSGMRSRPPANAFAKNPALPSSRTLPHSLTRTTRFTVPPVTPTKRPGAQQNSERLARRKPYDPEGDGTVPEWEDGRDSMRSSVGEQRQRGSGGRSRLEPDLLRSTVDESAFLQDQRGAGRGSSRSTVIASRMAQLQLDAAQSSARRNLSTSIAISVADGDVRRCPIALRVPRNGSGFALTIRSTEIPAELEAALWGNLRSHFADKQKNNAWKSMAVSNNTCILFKAYRHKYAPSGNASLEMACGTCTNKKRPCALLQEVDGEDAIVFLPLPENLRQGKSWREAEFWVAV
ncbi:hypothetical protein CC80DRAFT_318539 [Byssothecium circinans]|uniref:Uncharacterized protein n=1 Tax=Byssothecium circinans TaxID=147558 RepID=A0A6A5U2Z7_9PLEO|nr:hypothetical protein CC80DRAFT_318539 [Byssothecium circinans]